MHRLTALTYGVISYAIFFGAFLYTIGFLGNFAVPKSIDSATSAPLATALLVDGLLLALFAIQHSVMARPGFKRWWTRFVPQPIERATYVLMSSLVLILLFWAWQPLGGHLWQIENPLGRVLLSSMFFLGLATVLYSTFLIDHFDLFGLRQVVLHFQGGAYSERAFATPGLYRHVRHPLYVGWFLTFWMTPDMSMGRLLFAVACTLYILAAIPLEERDLAEALGDDYRDWRQQTPMFIPRTSADRVGAQAEPLGS